MERIAEYWTVHGKTVREIDGKVNDAIAEGYQPYGNQFVSNGQAFQVVVKYENQTIKKANHKKAGKHTVDDIDVAEVEKIAGKKR